MNDDINYRELVDKILKEDGTGNRQVEYKEIVYPFDKYEVKIRLTLDNKFIEIVEVKVNKEFLSYKQKKSKRGYHDVDEFYRD